jgi:hypothetical protein
VEYIGITIDSIAMEVRISEARLLEIMEELLQWIHRTFCTKRQLLSLIGKLTFISRVVKSGRTFLRRLIDCAKETQYLHHRVTLSQAVRQDIEWWIQYLPTWNGISVFCDSEWSSNAELHLWTDASDSGIGGFFRNEWFSAMFTGDSSYMQDMDINWRELYALLVAVTWSNRLRGKMVKFHCDNQSVCYIIQSVTSRDPSIMALVRTLFFVSARNSFVCSAVHVPGCKNQAADALSRGKIETFKSIKPESDHNPLSNVHIPLDQII